MTKPNFIQWKGTDLCMDLYCPECDTHSHIDGFFAYYVRCPSCKAVFKLADHVEMTKVEPGAALDIEPVEGTK